MIYLGLLEDLFSAAFHETNPPPEPTFVMWHVSEFAQTHCAACEALDGCRFTTQNVPPRPQHPFCQCWVEPIPLEAMMDEASAECNISKFRDYVFNAEITKNGGKKALFESWGYTAEDSEWLQQEFERQALEKYIAGQYTLGKLDKYGQRISILIDLLNKNTNETVIIKSGWMVRPDGSITLNTPLAGR